jgi:flavin-dependent dehydrogenase
VQALPRLYFPGGVLVGCAAGVLNTVKIKGTHTAMKSGILAAESIFDALQRECATTSQGSKPLLLIDYEERLKKSYGTFAMENRRLDTDPMSALFMLPLTAFVVVNCPIRCRMALNRTIFV